MFGVVPFSAVIPGSLGFEVVGRAVHLDGESLRGETGEAGGNTNGFDVGGSVRGYRPGAVGSNRLDSCDIASNLPECEGGNDIENDK